jgi:hypothetical protein
VIFEDKFQNASKNEKNEFAYVALAFYDQDTPIMLFKINGPNAGEKIREIANPCKQICASFGFYEEENPSKSFLVCGFRCSEVCFYDIAKNEWLPQKFKTESDVTCIKIVS